MCGSTQLVGTLFNAQPQTVWTRSASYNSLSRLSSQYAVWAVVMETDKGTFYESPGSKTEWPDFGSKLKKKKRYNVGFKGPDNIYSHSDSYYDQSYIEPTIICQISVISHEKFLSLSQISVHQSDLGISKVE